MADTTVPVDTAAPGKLPGEICAGTGRPADGWLTLEATAGRPSPFSSAWFIPLAVLGAVFIPLGLLLILSALLWRRLTAGRETTPVQLPWSEGDYIARARLERLQRRGHTLLFTGIITASIAAPIASNRSPASLGLPAILAVLGALPIAAGLGLMALGLFQIRKAEVTAHLDASRRWVTFRNVHPDFAAAVEDSAAAQRPGLQGK